MPSCNGGGYGFLFLNRSKKFTDSHQFLAMLPVLPGRSCGCIVRRRYPFVCSVLRKEEFKNSQFLGTLIHLLIFLRTLLLNSEYKGENP